MCSKRKFLVKYGFLKLITYLLQSPPPKEFNKRNEFDGYIDIGKELAILHNLMTENLPRVNQKVSNISQSLCIIT